MAVVPLNTLQEIQAKLASLEELLTFSKKNDNELLTPEQAAKMLGVSLRTLQTYRDNKLIPFSQYDRKIWYKKQDIIDFIDSKRVERRSI